MKKGSLVICIADLRIGFYFVPDFGKNITFSGPDCGYVDEVTHVDDQHIGLTSFPGLEYPIGLFKEIIPEQEIELEITQEHSLTI